MLKHFHCFVRVFVVFNMGRRGKKGPEQQSGPWMEAARARLRQHEEARGDATTGLSEELFVQLGTRPRRALAAGELVAPAGEPREFLLRKR